MNNLPKRRACAAVPNRKADELNFSNIPDEELYPCCLWEYARESRKIHELIRRIGVGSRSPSNALGNSVVRFTDEAFEKRDLLLKSSKEITTIDSEESCAQAIELMKEAARHLKMVAQITALTNEPFRDTLKGIDRKFDKLKEDAERLRNEISKTGVAPPDGELKRLKNDFEAALLGLPAWSTCPSVGFLERAAECACEGCLFGD